MSIIRKTLLLIPVAVFGEPVSVESAITLPSHQLQPSIADHQNGLEAVYDPSEPYPYARPAFLYYSFLVLRLLSSVLLLPILALLLLLRIKSRPRRSWSIAQYLLVEFNRRASGVSDLAGTRWGVRDPRAEPSSSSLKETRFEWVGGLTREKQVGVMHDTMTHPSDVVGCYVWDTDEEGSALKDGAEAGAGLVGIYAHGGSYLHQSAHESLLTSAIPRRLMKMGAFDSIYSVEYRLLPSPFPAALQDVASVYCALTDRGVHPSRVVLIGDSTGGNIMLALARWIRDERIVPRPAGLLLLSPWSDPSYSFPASFEFYNPRPHPEDYLSDHPQARLHLVRSLLGPHRDHSSLRDPYISLAAVPIPEGSFNDFPRTFIHYGDAERLEEEIDSLVRAMAKDSVALTVEKTKDAAHDVLVLQLWDEKVKQQICRRVGAWLANVEGGANEVHGK